MGASHTTLASASGDEGILPELEGVAPGSSTSNSTSQTNNAAKHDLSAYSVDQPLFPGSGRMMRTFRLRHKQNASAVILKTMFVSKEQEKLVAEQEQELRRILDALAGQAHVAPFLYWSLGPYKQKPMGNNMPATVRQASLLRPCMYTTLSDRIASRPFLTHVEKLWISYQILQALDAMHSKGVIHGFLTAENVGLTSWNWVVLMDVASYKARISLPDDDPTEYLYYFQENFSHPYAQGTDTTRREKRCYLAPERFFTPSRETPKQIKNKQRLTPAMDIFSAGCVIMETFLNGERSLDLGDLMEYRKEETSGTLQQKLNKIEFSAVRAACRHMLHLNPTERLSAKAYIERLNASDLIPVSYKVLDEMMKKVASASPDARLAIAAAFYAKVLWETMGVKDSGGEANMRSLLGSTMHGQLNMNVFSPIGEQSHTESKAECQRFQPSEEKMDDCALQKSTCDLFSETEALLKMLENLNVDKETSSIVASKESQIAANDETGDISISSESRSEMSQSSLIIYLQLILSTAKHVQRPSSRLVALHLMDRLGRHCSDEARLQRIVPVALSLLQDQDPLVRALSIQVVSNILNLVESFPPSDSKIFPDYIFKRVAHLITDPSLVVRLSFARSVATLAETSQRFLDISQAVRLYEAVEGGNGSGTGSHKEKVADSSDGRSKTTVFTEDLANLLDGASSDQPQERKNMILKGSSERDSSGPSDKGGNLISSTYVSDLAGLHEIVSRWVVHITTDQSEQSSPVKRALLADMARLCQFFGLDGVMAFILPQLLSFLNDRKDWELREALFECLPSVCNIIGRAATEHFVLPCLETALLDGVESVVSRALQCLGQLVTMGLVSRPALLGETSTSVGDAKPGILQKYAPLLVHPSVDIRFFAVETINAFCRSIGHPDAEVFVIPIIRCFLRFQPSYAHLTSREAFEKSLKAPWSRERFFEELATIQPAHVMSPTAGHWTSVGFQVQHDSVADQRKPHNPGETVDQQTRHVRGYLSLLARNRAYHMQVEKDESGLRTQLNHSIEGSLKLSQQIKFPKQNTPGLPDACIPRWYHTLRDVAHGRLQISESVAIRSVSSLGQIYGLSIMDQNATAPSSPLEDLTEEDALKLLSSAEAKQIEAASGGQWGSEICLDPTLSDTSLLVTKLNALHVPPLPPKLVADKITVSRATLPGKGSTRDQTGNGSEWKLKIDTMVASSKCTPEHGHIAPIVRLVVSNDQRFFATGSHDSTCRIWEIEKAERSNGVLQSSTVYTGHQEKKDIRPRVNDIAVIEGGHSVVSGASDGSVHVWRVDLVSSSKNSAGPGSEPRDVSRVVGSTEIRRSSHNEGEILTVNHFNTSSASILTYATQVGSLHSWDLRSASEPFTLKIPQDTGYVTSIAMGNDRNWLVMGTSQGFISLWDLRFQQMLKLWHHSRESPVNRLATSFVPPPQSWFGRGGANSESRPFVFAACGPNECGMFDLMTGACRECFRTVDYGSRFSKSRLDEMPSLREISSSSRRRNLLQGGYNATLRDTVTSSFRSVNAMVGSIGASDQSFLITGGSDCRIRYWDFSMPSKCYVSAGPETVQPRPTFERIDYSQSSRLMLCRQPPTPTVREVDGSKIPRKLLQGAKRSDKIHEDAITDLKMFNNGLLSCSRDCTVKIWR